MKQRATIGICGILLLAGFIAISQTSPKAPTPPKSLKDTIPSNEKRIKNFDDALKDLDKAMLDLDVELKKPLPPIPPVEVEKIRSEIDKALKDIDPDKIKKEVELAMKEIDGEKLKLQIESAMAKVDMDKIKKEIETLRNIELPKIEIEMKNLKPQIEKSLQNAKISLELAKKELEEYKAFETSLEKEGLINTKETYTIEHKDGKLIINGKTQPEVIYNKFRSFLEKHKSFTWKRDSNGLMIDND